MNTVQDILDLASPALAEGDCPAASGLKDHAIEQQRKTLDLSDKEAAEREAAPLTEVDADMARESISAPWTLKLSDPRESASRAPEHHTIRRRLPEEGC